MQDQFLVAEFLPYKKKQLLHNEWRKGNYMNFIIITY